MLKNGIFIFTIALLILLFFLPSYKKLQALKARNADYARQLERLKQENKDLEFEMKRLEEEPHYLEEVARDKMGLMKEGEVVIKLRPANVENQNHF